LAPPDAVRRGNVTASAGARHPADEIDAGQNIAPLVVAAHLERALAGPEEVQEIIGLEQLIIELDEGQTLLHAHPVGLGGQHPVDAEMAPDVAQESHIIQGQEPIGVVDGDSPPPVEIQVAVKLGLDRDAEAADRLLRQQRAHLGPAAGIADHSRTAADDGQSAMPGPPQVGHGHDRDETPGMEAGRRAVIADIERDRTFAEHFPHGFFIGHLGDESAVFQFVENVSIHGRHSPWMIGIKGRAFGSPLARGLYPRASTAEVDPRAKPGAPAAVCHPPFYLIPGRRPNLPPEKKGILQAPPAPPLKGPLACYLLKMQYGN
jgi:hypothetical protein